MSLLKQPLQINNLVLSNRLVMPPMASAKPGGDGNATQELCDYYTEKSKGGYVGLIITEHSYISPEGKAHKGQLSMDGSCDMAGLKKLVQAIHQNGSKTIAQINHAGGVAKPDLTGHPALAPSAVKFPKAADSDPLPTEMDASDIKKVVADFAAAAIRAKEAGFDGVELHSAHGYLLNQFYSPLSNKRTDSYGGPSVLSRIRLHLEIIEAVRTAVGTDYPLALRLGACDYMEGGSTLQDSVTAAKRFEEAGVDLLDISGGFCGYLRPGAKTPGYFSELTEAIREAVSIPVLLTGGITDASAAEALLSSGKADLIGVGRAILKDSGWPQKAMDAL